MLLRRVRPGRRRKCLVEQMMEVRKGSVEPFFELLEPQMME